MHKVKTAQPRWQLFEVDAKRDLTLTSELEVSNLPEVFLFLGSHFNCQLQTETHPEAVISTVLTALQQPAREAP